MVCRSWWRWTSNHRHGFLATVIGPNLEMVLAVVLSKYNLKINWNELLLTELLPLSANRSFQWLMKGQSYLLQEHSWLKTGKNPARFMNVSLGKSVCWFFYTEQNLKVDSFKVDYYYLLRPHHLHSRHWARLKAVVYSVHYWYTLSSVTCENQPFSTHQHQPMVFWNSLRASTFYECKYSVERPWQAHA